MLKGYFESFKAIQILFVKNYQTFCAFPVNKEMELLLFNNLNFFKTTIHSSFFQMQIKLSIVQNFEK